MRLAALCCGLLLLTGSARAQGQEGAPPALSAPSVSEEFVGLFTSYCLAKFPDDAALVVQLGDDRRDPLTPAQVKGFLHDDPGQGWLISGTDSKYVLTDEQPPFHACALRRYADHVLDGAPLIAAARAFAAAAGRKLASPQVSQHTMANGLISDAELLQVLDDKGQPLSEAFMFFVTAYPAVPRPDGTLSKPFFDIRFVRQIYGQKT